MMPKKKKTTWADSEAKEALRKALASGSISTDRTKTTPKQAFCPEYDFDGQYCKFGPRFRALQSTVGKAQAAAAEDLSLFLADHEESQKIGSNGKPRWDGSAAEQLLRVAVADGVEKDMKPAALQGSSSTYKDFASKTFRDHIYQERKTQKWVKNQYPKSYEKMVDKA